MPSPRQEWLNDLIAQERAAGYQQGLADGIVQGLQMKHQAANLDVPYQFTAALQRGPAGGPVDVIIENVTVCIEPSAAQTGIPNPDVREAWAALQSAVRAAMATEPGITSIHRLPPEIASASWVDGRGDAVTIRCRRADSRGACDGSSE